MSGCKECDGKLVVPDGTGNYRNCACAVEEGRRKSRPAPKAITDPPGPNVDKA